MKFGANKLSSSVRLALSLGAVIAVGASMPAFAQDSGTSSDSSSQKNPQNIQTVVVTGSHIRRVDMETSNPVVTLDRAQIQATGKTTLGDLVQDLPAVTGGVTNPQVNNGGGDGSSTIGLRGLGSQRTLILVNGHRVISSDVNSIPTNMIERVEVLTDGASSTYGSDAIGGVVNFILRKDYKGAEITTTFGQSQRGDGTQKGYTFTFGQTGDKGSIFGGLSYNKTDAVEQSQRDFSKNAISLFGSSQTPIYSYIGGSSFPPNLNIQLPDSLAAQYGCSRVAANAGASGQNVNTDYHCFGNSDKYNYASVNLLMTPQERTSFFVDADYNIGDNVTAYMNLYHTKTTSSFQIAPALLGSLYGAVISADSYYNPFGQEFSSSGLDYRARLESVGDRAANYGTTVDQGSAGFKGNFSLLDQDWAWDVGMDYGHISQNLVTLGLPNQTMINADLGPSHMDASGKVVCDSGASGCTPFNPFDLSDPNSVAALQAAAVPAISNQLAIERIYRAEANGGLINLPAGTAQLALGVSYRKEYTNAMVDPLLKIDPTTGNCTLGSQCSSPLSGGYNVKEAYGELFVPVLADMPGVYSLNVDIGDRYSKFSTFGSTNNTKFAVEYRPIQSLLLRGTVAEVFRAPTISDVYGAPISDAPKLSSDPCDGYTGGGNPACVGVPTDGSFTNTDVALGQQIKGIQSGSQYANFNLGPESGKSFDWGLVYSPSWAPGLSATVDFWKIYLNNTVTTIGAQTVLNQCYAGQTAFCGLITRNPAGSNDPGQITQIVEPTGNLGRTDAQGIDSSFRYRVPEFGYGHFTLGLDATYLQRYDQQTAPGQDSNVVYHDAGHFETYGSAQASTCPSGGGVCLFPRWRGKGFVDWQMGNWVASWRMRYIGGFRMGSKSPTQDVHPAGPYLDGIYYDYGATVYNDVQVGYEIKPIHTRIDLGVNNVFDKQPPMLYANNSLNANTDPSDFDMLGRYYWARLTFKF
ncbi:TonB-dependent receptor plug domain-containing protein [Oleiagrimonas sp. C23AA]|uniref:TonB-dependent receptor plug domain-containing protein n=1 Tax=Oleiagrimonas sp. C23AA TaxID=2719047 RepID=UPI00142246B0|nr:TonB-dependent receptor plug domain-containing protein [Oleiagrimonas sp. C23AA]NII11962.1 TonB-dependent receptor [Oleiagrimonas sp. C23AA]